MSRSPTADFRLLGVLFSALISGACATMPVPKVTRHEFPKQQAFVEIPERPFRKLGLVRTKVTWQSLDPEHEEAALCTNYYNKAVKDLVRRARENGGDAVMQIRTVVFLFDGRQETYSTPECADDGGEGQVLAEAIAIKWEKPLPGDAPVARPALKKADPRMDRSREFEELGEKSRGATEIEAEAEREAEPAPARSTAPAPRPKGPANRGVNPMLSPMFED